MATEQSFLHRVTRILRTGRMRMASTVAALLAVAIVMSGLLAAPHAVAAPNRGWDLREHLGTRSPVAGAGKAP